MRPVFLWFILSISTGFAHAQRVVIQLDKMNVAYIGIDNPISIANNAVSSDQLVVKVDNGRITGKNGEYIYTPEKAGIATIDVFAKTRKGLKKMGSYMARVKKLPSPEISIAGKTSGYISRLQLSGSFGPECTFPNCDLDMQYTIVSFTVTLLRAQDSSIVFQRSYTNIKNSEFDDETRTAFGLIKRGDIVEFSDFHISSTDGTVRTMNNLKFKISN